MQMGPSTTTVLVEILSVRPAACCLTLTPKQKRVIPEGTQERVRAEAFITLKVKL
jgi:hypothetical protein